MSEFVISAGRSASSVSVAADQVQYTNAKVLLVGNSAAGKTGLSNRLALDTYKETDSTVGAWATQWKLPLPAGDAGEKVADRSASEAETLRPTERSATVEREVWLNDVQLRAGTLLEKSVTFR